MSRELTIEEKEILQKRKNNFNNFLEERMPVLRDFMQGIGIPEPHMVLLDAESFISPLNSYLQDQKIMIDDKNWILTVIGYFIGELFVQKYDGYWFLNEKPEASSFLKYVVGGFENIDCSLAIDPFETAKDYVEEGTGRNLEKYINEIEIQLRAKR